VLQSIAVCCSQMCCSALQSDGSAAVMLHSFDKRVLVCCSVLQCVAVRCVAVCCSQMCCTVWQCVAVKCVAVCCSVLQSNVLQFRRVFASYSRHARETNMERVRDRERE